MEHNDKRISANLPDDLYNRFVRLAHRHSNEQGELLEAILNWMVNQSKNDHLYDKVENVHTGEILIIHNFEWRPPDRPAMVLLSDGSRWTTDEFDKNFRNIEPQ